jgi:DEAD/DEAH box helicase domain-containing protein
VKSNTPPDVVLLDELHLFSSLFGGNVGHLLRRLEHAIEHYHRRNTRPKIQFIATSATVKNPIGFGRDFFDRDVSVIQTTEEDYDFSRTYSKVVVFASPRAYRMIDSVSYSLYQMLATSKLRILTFVNSLTLSSMLLNLTRQRLSADPRTESLVDNIDGHSSNYTRQERAETEEKFNAGKIRVLVATSTLEVGVDFKGLDGLALYGAPYTFNNYLQRIGRAGRNNDAIVFVFLNPDDPIDLSYFRNAIKLAADPTSFVEYPPFPVGNEVLKHKHMLCSVLDISTVLGEDSSLLFKELMLKKSISNPLIQQYLEEMWDANNIRRAADLLRIAQGVPESQLQEFITKKFNLFDMRKVDETVLVEFEEPYDYKSRFTRSTGMAKGRYKALRSAGLTSSDIDTLKKLKGG